jgi:hypothetical protein
MRQLEIEQSPSSPRGFVAENLGKTRKACSSSTLVLWSFQECAIVIISCIFSPMKKGKAVDFKLGHYPKL